MSIEQLLQQIALQQPKHPQLLRLLFRELTRDENHFNNGLRLLSQHPEWKAALQHYIQHLFKHKDLSYTLIESGISSRTGFTAEIIRKLKHSLLPEEKHKNTFHVTVIDIIGSQKPDTNQLTQLFEHLEITIDFNTTFLKNELIDAIEILSYRITASAIESEFIQKFKHNSTLNSFIRQNKEIHALIAQYTLGIDFNPHLVQHINELLLESLNDVQHLRKSVHHQGASLQLSYSLHRITQQIERLQLLFALYSRPQLSGQRLAQFITQLYVNELSKNSIRRQLNDTTYLLAHQITEHESKTGEHYIAENRNEYKHMFTSSCGGGVFAAAMTLIKLMLHHLAFAPFWQALVYSLNYAGGFVGIQITHATLATKQPAMTASKIAHSLDTQGKDEDAIKGLALMIGKVSRSQFISFAGNLLVVFPLAFALAWIWKLTTGHQLVETKEAQHMLHDVHPFKNPTWLYASITGVYLFLSGIISGYYDNKVIYSRIPQRIRQHPVLQKLLTKRRLIALSLYIENNLGSLIGNICLGFFLGTAGFIGFIFGLPFDIRHITISSGNYAIAIFTLLPNLNWTYALTCLLGVLGIGAFNFLVSFSLATYVAARSRKVGFKLFGLLLRWTITYFRKYPLDFFIAPKSPRNLEDIG